MQTAKTYNGIFSLADSSTSGHLVIAGAESALNLVTAHGWPLGDDEYVDLHGFLADGRKASALQCIRHLATQHRWDENARYESNYFPHYVVLGETFIKSDDAVINAVHYQFENADCLVSGRKTFMSLHPTPDETRAILEADHKRAQEISKEHGWGERPFDPEIGEHPHLLYYSGVWEFARANADIGTVSLNNGTSHSMGHSKGIGIENQITVEFRFHAPKTLEEATRALWRLHSLFELALGRRQRFLKIELETTHAKEETPDAAAWPRHELHWSYCNENVRGESKTTHIVDVLLRPDERKDEFAAVVSGWLNTTPAMGEARSRFASGFYGGFEINRIVGAANMFDLLPEDRAPKVREVDQQTKEAVEQSRAIFRALPESPARQSVLDALGRVGAASLRDKVLHRAKIVLEASGGKFPEIEIPCVQAVLCRNHFVHGRKAVFDYADKFNAFAFLTNTLEFVFAISDLVELGWSFEKWREHGFTMSNEFSAYVINYEGNMAELKAVLPPKAA
jgi:hypothetical protein